MKNILLLLIALAITSLSANGKSDLPTKWIKGGRTVTLHLGPSLTDTWSQSASYYSISPCKGSTNTDYVRSLITSVNYSKNTIPQIFLSPSGKTMLIVEDVGDASPLFQHILIYHDSQYTEDQVRHLSFRSYGIQGNLTKIISLNDKKVIFKSYPNATQYSIGKEKIQKKRIQDIPEADPHTS